MSLALRLRESRWFRSALEQPYTQPENRLNGAGNGDLGLQGTKYVRTEKEAWWCQIQKCVKADRDRSYKMVNV